MSQAFSGLRILDFSQVFAGPFAVSQLALLGAEVIKVEQPGQGDQARSLMNETDDINMSPAFMTMNINKRSLTLNLKHPKAVEIVKQLIPQTDVVVENFKAGTMAKMGLDYDSLKALRPDLIYCSISGYGQTGPKAGAAAYDGAIQAASGMMSQNGHPQTGPTRTGFMVVDMSTALNAAFAISASLYRRAVTGEGQYLDVSMLDTAILMQATQFSNLLNQNMQVGLLGNVSPTGQPTANVFPTSNGYIQITALQQAQVEKLFAVMGIEDKLEEDPFRSPGKRKANGQQVFDTLCETLRTRTTAEWIADINSAGVPVSEIMNLPDVVADSQLQERMALVSMQSPAYQQDITVAGSGYITNEDGPSAHSPAPALGQHTVDILGELGFEAAAISALYEEGVI